MVAGVYSNRLQARHAARMPTRPSSIPITKGRPLGRRILQSELDANNGYNTYALAGLPIGPIANPGRDSIAAVLNPAPTQALYFVADGTGGHVFADTLAEHNANVASAGAPSAARAARCALAQPALPGGVMAQPDEQQRHHHDRDWRLLVRPGGIWRRRPANQENPTIHGQDCDQGQQQQQLGQRLQKQEQEAAKSAAEDGDRKGRRHPGRHRALPPPHLRPATTPTVIRYW